MRQFATQSAFFEPTPEPSFNADLMLLAIERALAPPLVHQRNTFQPMRIVIVDPTLLAHEPGCADERAERKRVLPRAMPASTNIAAFQQRAVRGEILSDESGRLYEKLGRRIRPIHQLASGQAGEVIDLVPTGTQTAPLSPQKTEAKVGEVRSGNDGESTTVQETVAQPARQISHRTLFADPGQWRVIWWGEFKEILARQLAHPERLKDTYRLPCYVQVLETERQVAISELAAVCKSDNERRAGLYLLTDEIATKLDLVLPLRPAPQPQFRREPNTLLAHERVFRLIAANDPTIDVTNLMQKKNQSAAVAGESQLREPLKNSIPGRFVKEWDFKFTREEALYDMNANRTISSLLGQLFRKLFTRRGELRKWQVLLAGRSVDEQLWAVRPPAGLIADSQVRDWAVRTLQLGGYETREMINEWEIFWRRRGR